MRVHPSIGASPGSRKALSGQHDDIHHRGRYDHDHDHDPASAHDGALPFTADRRSHIDHDESDADIWRDLATDYLLVHHCVRDVHQPEPIPG
jgi:hypothetical protein